MAEETRTFNITGEAAKALMGGTKRRRTAKKKGGDPVIDLTTIEKPVPVLVPAPAPVPIKQVEKPVEPKPVELKPVEPKPIEGGMDTRKFKVELKKNITAKKVQLHPKKDEPQRQPVKKMQTRKHRKVLLGIRSLHRRMTRAKKMQKKATEMPLDKLKEELIKKKLIKPTSKAPESVLRQIAADAQIVENKAL